MNNTNGLTETTFNNGRLSIEMDDMELITDETFESESLEVPGETSHGTLMTDGSTHLIKRTDLKRLPVPTSTRSFQPIPHDKLVNCLEETLSFRNLKLTKTEFAVSPDGMKLFGLLEINAVAEGIRFAIGLRNSNDKSMRLGMVAGYRVTVCSNMMFAGDFDPLLAKHTPGFDLTDSMSVAVDRIHRGFKPLKESIQLKKLILLSDMESRSLIYQIFLEEKFPISLIKTVHKHYFEPAYEDFRETILWSLENAFTESFKELQPLSQYQTTAKFGKFIKPLLEADKADNDYQAETNLPDNSISNQVKRLEREVATA